MNKKEYHEYLKSKEWKQKRAAAIRRAKSACQLCNQTTGLNVHHRTYARVGHEQASDLIVLCRACHSKFHDTLTEFAAEQIDLGDWFDTTAGRRFALREARASGLGRWIELAWYRLMREVGLSSGDAIESVSKELNGGGWNRSIDE